MANKTGKKYVGDNVQLMSEWDWESNDREDLNPKQLTHGSTKHVHWRCNRGHRYTARIDHRTIMGSGCPYCAGKLPVQGENDLSITHPELIHEWDYENNEKSPQMYLAGSNKKVGWVCSKCGNRWQTQIISRALRNTGCPVCMQKQRGKTKSESTIARRGSLNVEFPELVQEWDDAKNLPLTPETVHGGSKRIVWWRGNCNHSWRASIQNRVAGNGCPICAGKIVITGQNDFKTNFPEISVEWHPCLNEDLSPEQVSAHSERKVWWLCPKCNEAYYTSIYSRTSLKTGCPVCKNRKVVQGKNDLVTTHPEIAGEWNYTQNGDLKPENFVAGANRKVWWICEKGHEWKASINDRKSGRGCPICNGERKTSFPEQVLYYYLSKVTTAINRYRFLGREIDIYLKEQNTGIEYNGSYYHRNRTQEDDEKYEFFRKNGIRIIVIHEGNESHVDGDAVFFQYVSSDYLNLDQIVRTVFELCGLPPFDIDIKRDRSSIYEQYMLSEKSNSLAAKYPWLIDEWDYDRNGKLTPWHVSYGSNKRIWWKCSCCGYGWEAVASSRKKNGCPCCANQVVAAGINDLGTKYPMLAEEWDLSKNEISPSEISAKSHKYAWWICGKGHSWRAKIKSRVQGIGCPVCAGKVKVK